MKDNKERTDKDLNNISFEKFYDSATDIDFISVMKLIVVTTYFTNMLLLYAMFILMNG